MHPIDLVRLAELVEQGAVEGVPDACFLPIAQPALAGAPAAQLQRQHVPVDTGLEDGEDAAQRRAIRQPGPTALGVRGVRWQERGDDGPQFGSCPRMDKGGAAVMQGVLIGQGSNRTGMDGWKSY